jgi:hypothetical protein
MIHRAGLQAPAAYQGSSQLQLAGGSQWLASLPREERELAELVGPGRFKVTTADGVEEVAADHFVVLDSGALVIRSPQGNDLSVWAAGCWSRVELVG